MPDLRVASAARYAVGQAFLPDALRVGASVGQAFLPDPYKTRSRPHA